MGNQIVFPENNQLPRDLFSCGQSKQAVSLYNSNYQLRIDKMGVILNYGQLPLVKSRYMKYINNEEHPYGENPIVAIMCYNGYNVEDAILVNEGSVDRGFFRTTYYNMYESYEESSKISGNEINGINQSASIVDANPKRKRRNLSFFSWFPIMRMDVFIAIQLIKIGVKIVPSDLGQYTFHHQH